MQNENNLALLKKELGNTIFPLSSGLHQRPTCEHVCLVLDYLNISLKDICHLTGASYRVDRWDSATVRAWRKGSCNIPYSAWVILILKAGLITVDELI